MVIYYRFVVLETRKNVTAAKRARMELIIEMNECTGNNPIDTEITDYFDY
jgi:hypothetical protein